MFISRLYVGPILVTFSIFLYLCLSPVISLAVNFSEEKKVSYREKVRQMFYHAYNGYLNHAYPLDELRPLTCTGMDTWGSFSLTLIDALDTLLIMGNYSEFQRAVSLVLENVDVDANVNVSVFETNIRVVGGLLSAHMLSGRIKGYELPSGWPCAGPLLDLAERFAQKLLPAFNTNTGMPYGTVNLRYGVNHYETPITCTAGVGTFILEFGVLSRLTGNPHYERIALKALKALWDSRSPLNLVGNHVNVQTGVWTATDAGIGAGVDSYFEYLAKGGLLFQRPLLMHQFYEYEKAINAHVRKEDWFMWVSMAKAQVSLPIFQSLEAFWPGVLALIGKVDDASRILLTYNQVLRQYGLPPEFYNLPNREATSRRSGYPLRPEIAESLLYVYQATEDPLYLHIAASIIEAIEKIAKTDCGYATVRDVTDHSLEDRMESFFLSETTKYLFLIFDSENFIHNDGTQATIIQTTDGECAIDAGGYIFNTEAHPIDPAIVYCCSSKRQNDSDMMRRFEDNIDFLSLLDLNDPNSPSQELKFDDLDKDTAELNTIEESLSKEEEQWIIERSADLKGAKEKTPQVIENPKVHSDIQTEQEIKRSRILDDIGHEQVGVTEEKTSNTRKASKEKEVTAEANEEGFDSELSQEVGKLFEEIGLEFKGLVKSSDKLQKFSISPTLDKAMKRVRRRQMARDEPITEAICEDCCVPMDQTNDSKALRRMLNVIYGKHVYPKLGISVAQGPICRPWERPKKRRKTYFNTPPNADEMEPLERQRLDAVDGYSLNSFTYSRLANERYDLLSSETRPFEAAFTGLGQVMPVKRYDE
ncbi:glycosyl hydrolase family 47 domain-containing protein [Ditylenchus destructor]|nr:glycosyl hydrolase family 47 domain-containing protein [Ditylenchus destructor]